MNNPHVARYIFIIFCLIVGALIAVNAKADDHDIELSQKCDEYSSFAMAREMEAPRYPIQGEYAIEIYNHGIAFYYQLCMLTEYMQKREHYYDQWPEEIPFE